MDRLIRVCFVLGLISEAVKVLCVVEILPVVEPAIENGVLAYRQTGAFAPYLQAEHLPLELCSLQILSCSCTCLSAGGAFGKSSWR